MRGDSSGKKFFRQTSATTYYADVVNPSCAVGKTVDALVDRIAKEETNIRENPVARTTEILKKVFGSVAH